MTTLSTIRRHLVSLTFSTTTRTTYDVHTRTHKRIHSHLLTHTHTHTNCDKTEHNWNRTKPIGLDILYFTLVIMPLLHTRTNRIEFLHWSNYIITSSNQILMHEFYAMLCELPPIVLLVLWWSIICEFSYLELLEKIN